MGLRDGPRLSEPAAIGETLDNAAALFSGAHAAGVLANAARIRELPL